MAQYTIRWTRTQYWASKLGKPPGRVTSRYAGVTYDQAKEVAQHMNRLSQELNVEVVRAS